MTNNIRKEFKEIDEGSSNKATLNLIQFIEQTLPNFPKSQEFVSVLETKKNENQHSRAFCLYMTHKSKANEYVFIPETAQIGSHTIDIGIYWGNNLIFTIEAKRLPTPKGSKQKPRNEHEYVYGNGAGIQRFREGFHGVDNRNKPLPENGMIAYIQKEDFEYWFSKINQWVLDAHWDKSEQLEKVYFKKIGRLTSTHPRQNDSNIKLHHFWIYVN